MEAIGKEQILARIRAENPWWLPPHGIPQDWSSLGPRPFLRAFRALLEPRAPHRAVVLLGPRRVGKTVLLHHAIQGLLRTGTHPARILFLSLDSPVYTDLALHELLQIASEARGSAEPWALVAFDEVQYHRDWERHLKVLVDTERSSRFIASGSAAAALRLKSIESGAGRFTDFFLPPLTFFEHVVMTGNRGLAEQALQDVVDPQTVRRLNELFVEHINFGGYPEALFSETVRSNPARFLRQDVIDKVLLRDLPSLYGISDIQELNRLFAMLAWNTGRELSLDDLSRGSGVSKNTIKKYIEYLQAAFLVDVVHRVDRDLRHFQRATTFKVYLTNPSMRAALFAPADPDGEGFGHLVETCVFAQYPGFMKDEAYYARWHRGEVDFVFLAPDGSPAEVVEVKWTDRFAEDPEQLKELCSFLQHRTGLRVVTLTTRTKAGRRHVAGVPVNVEPASSFCLWLGMAAVSAGVFAQAEGLVRPSAASGNSTPGKLLDELLGPSS